MLDPLSLGSRVSREISYACVRWCRPKEGQRKFWGRWAKPFPRTGRIRNACAYRSKHVRAVKKIFNSHFTRVFAGDGRAANFVAKQANFSLDQLLHGVVTCSPTRCRR